jgi:hypothetical protein
MRDEENDQYDPEHPAHPRERWRFPAVAGRSTAG